MANNALQHIPESTRRRVRWVFAAFAGLMFVQYQVLQVAGEPYPALLLPAFRSTGATDDKTRVRRLSVRFLREGRVVHTCSRGDLLEGIPVSYHSAIAGRVFSPVHPEDTIDDTRDRLALLLFPGHERAHRDHLAGRNSAPLRRWLHDRARQLVPGTPVDEVVFDWGFDLYDLSQSPPACVEERPDGSFAIRLKGTGDGPTRIASH